MGAWKKRINAVICIEGLRMDDLVAEFLSETVESLEIVDVELVKFEQDPSNVAGLDKVFRLLHTVKGSAGFLGLDRLGTLAHSTETLIDCFRDGAPVSDDSMTLTLEAIDRFRWMLEVLSENGQEPEGDDKEMLDRLAEMSKEVRERLENPSKGEAKTEKGESKKEEELSPEELNALFEQQVAEAEAAMAKEEQQNTKETSQDEKKASEVALNQQQHVAPDKPSPAKENSEPSEPKEAKGKLKSTSIRVNMDTIEHMMTMVSELVLTRNQLIEIIRQKDDASFNAPLQRLSSITSELQEGVMQTRMQPIGTAWQQIPRLIRSLNQQLNKHIEIEMIGSETELDRQVLELIRDPMTHMIRNSADHGIETPKEREEAGKTGGGTITLKAHHEGGHIILSISDDGKGINAEKVKEKAIRSGLITEADAIQMSDNQILRCIFEPGFTTTSEVSAVSGRGVGMDVVRSNIELIGGSIDLESKLNQGTTFIIKIPLTLAIISALIVQIGDAKIAIPQTNVDELVRAQNNSEHRIEFIDKTRVLRLRNRLLPLIDLKEVLGLKKAESSDHSEDNEGFVIVANVGNRVFGILVDAVFHTEEIVVKPLSSPLRDIDYFSGNTLLGDGSVILIIDVNGIAKNVGSIAPLDQESEHTLHHENGLKNTSSMLLFKFGANEPKAVPLSIVTRLEDVPQSKIEHTSSGYVMQYRGRLMPLVTSENGVLPDRKTQHVLVFSDGDKTMGLVVDEILDIVNDYYDVELGSRQQGILGSAIIAEKATEIIDVTYYVAKAFSNEMTASEWGNQQSRKSILFVDDSLFFREMLPPILRSVGYYVTICESAIDALKLIENGGKFDVILSDLEMPEMDGIQFAEQIKSMQDYADIPMIALSSYTGSSVSSRCHQAGYLSHVAKYDREGLISSLFESISKTGAAA